MQYGDGIQCPPITIWPVTSVTFRKREEEIKPLRKLLLVIGDVVDQEGSKHQWFLDCAAFQKASQVFCSKLIILRSPRKEEAAAIREALQIDTDFDSGMGYSTAELMSLFA